MLMKDQNLMKTRFYFITHFYGKPISGGERYNFRLIRSILNNKIPITIYTDDSIPKFFQRGYIRYNIWYLFRINRFQSGTLIIDHYMHPKLFLFAFFIKIFTKVKILGIVHHLYWTIQTNPLSSWIDKKLESFFLSRLDWIVVPGEFTHNSINDLIKKTVRMNIIYPPVNIKSPEMHHEKRNYIKGGKINLLYVGGIYKRKGLTYLIEAFKNTTYQNIVLYLVGDQKAEPEYFEKIKFPTK